MENSNEKKVLWVSIDNKSNFKNHINELCKNLLGKPELYLDCLAI